MRLLLQLRSLRPSLLESLVAQLFPLENALYFPLVQVNAHGFELALVNDHFLFEIGLLRVAEKVRPGIVTRQALLGVFQYILNLLGTALPTGEYLFARRFQHFAAGGGSGRRRQKGRPQDEDQNYDGGPGEHHDVSAIVCG